MCLEYVITGVLKRKVCKDDTRLVNLSFQCVMFAWELADVCVLGIFIFYFSFSLFFFFFLRAKLLFLPPLVVF